MYSHQGCFQDQVAKQSTVVASIGKQFPTIVAANVDKKSNIFVPVNVVKALRVDFLNGFHFIKTVKLLLSFRTLSVH